MRYYRLITLSLYLAMAGCGLKTVYVPVSSCPVPQVIVMPDLAVNRLPQQPPTADTLKALAEDHIALRGELERCVTVLDGYRQK
jgi:hypothetical protein